MKPQALRDWRVILLAPQFLLLLSCTELQSVTCPTGLVCPAGEKCAAHQDVCIKDDCGDGVLQDHEACDDGNLQDGDGCRHDCLSLEACGDHQTDTATGEACDDGNTTSGDGCSADCKSAESCGNSYVDEAGGEQCDDGNTTGGDGCSADCGSNETCGNGVEDANERCDDGNTSPGDGCSADCQSDESCGNGIVDAAQGEKCDDGNTVSGDGCSGDCKSLEKCGNGIVEEANNELCDDGNTADGDGCNSDCRSGVGCGNGVRDAAEQCDDGNAMNNDNCLRSCVLARCGDGYVDLAFPGTEQCDDGNSLSCGTCGEACRQRQVPQPARGSIKAVDRASVRDGEVFAISDGRHRLFFEFNKSGEVPASHEPVNLENANNTSARAVAQAIADAIRKASDRYGSGKLRLWVHLPNGETTISLGAVEPGTHGNQAIIESVDDTDFIVEGMHAGAGYDCRAGTPCLRDEDCSYIDGNGRCMRAANEHLGVCGAR